MSPHAIALKAKTVFAPDAAAGPRMTLRGGNDLDDGRNPKPFDPKLDQQTDEYLSRYWWGITHLDPESFRHYMPHLIEYALHHIDEDNDVVEALSANLRPPDREPSRLGSMTNAQEEIIVDFLDLLAFRESTTHGESARLALEEWWAPGALYRCRSDDA